MDILKRLVQIYVNIELNQCFKCNIWLNATVRSDTVAKSH